MIGVARYPGPGRIVSRPIESMYSWARSGELGPSLCGLAIYIRIARQCETETGRLDTVVGEDIRELGDLIRNKSCIGGLGGSDCAPTEGRFVGSS